MTGLYGQGDFIAGFVQLLAKYRIEITIKYIQDNIPVVNFTQVSAGDNNYLFKLVPVFGNSLMDDVFPIDIVTNTRVITNESIDSLKYFLTLLHTNSIRPVFIKENKKLYRIDFLWTPDWNDNVKDYEEKTIMMLTFDINDFGKIEINTCE